MRGEDDDVPGTAEPGQPGHAFAVGDLGSFTYARCACGWVGFARRSRSRAYQDGYEHGEAADQPGGPA